MTAMLRRLWFIAMVCTLLCSGRAFAAQVVEPHPPVAIGVDAKGKPARIKIVATGFQPNAQVYVEQCDGTAPTTPQWSPTANCDLGSSPAPAAADDKGAVTFDGPKMFQAFLGESPQQLFNCTRRGDAAPKNGLPTSTNCQLRVSTNNSSATTDQVLVPIAFGATGSAPITSASRSTTTTTARSAVNGNAGKKRPAAAGTSKTSTTTTLPLVATSPPARSTKSSTSPTSSSAVAGYSFIIIGLAVAAAGRLGVRRRKA